ncbi:MAG TPA: hypothetical protein VFI09_00740 [Solirubrobacterales bacterium]|nr:hypothetical protein [Solirubrobacterales bacterium]
MSRLGLSAVAVAVSAILVAGCGGGSSDESTAAAPVETTETTGLDKAELITQGDGICAEVNAAIGSAGSTSSDAGEAVVQVAGLYSGMVERLKELGPPSDESAGYPEFISSAETLAQAEGNVKLAYEREEGEDLSAAATEVSSALTGFESSAQEFGFEKCAESPSAPTPGGTSEEFGGEESPGGFEAEEVEEAEEAAPEEVEAAPEEAPPAEEESAGGGAGVGGGTEGGGGSSGGSSGGIGPG